MPAVHGILETALYVKDLPKSAAFYRELFDLDTLLESDRLIALDVSGRSVLLLFREGATSEPATLPGGVIPGHGSSGRSHLAFAVAREELLPWKERLQSHGVAIESEVAWPGGAQSVFFRDLDNTLVELITPGFWRTY